mgnify:CR=1 FL=1
MRKRGRPSKNVLSLVPTVSTGSSPWRPTTAEQCAPRLSDFFLNPMFNIKLIIIIVWHINVDAEEYDREVVNKAQTVADPRTFEKDTVHFLSLFNKSNEIDLLKIDVWMNQWIYKGEFNENNLRNIQITSKN